jgi:hypothetical protein
MSKHTFYINQRIREIYNYNKIFLQSKSQENCLEYNFILHTFIQ